jgi:hypothetical protein
MPNGIDSGASFVRHKYRRVIRPPDPQAVMLLLEFYYSTTLLLEFY